MDFKTMIAAMMDAGDTVNAGKLKQIMDKTQRKLLMTAFCGHFSAGKSTLINRLCGRNLLPSSPIPTSANLVSIRFGDPQARIIYRGMTEQDERGLFRSVPLEKLAEYCVNGEEIETVDIFYPAAILEQGVTFLDTPGIDSTDPAHLAATESALHLADVVFYVMDYNHVQSEVNLAFTKRLQEMNKPLYLIINQIDKHHESEITFQEYKDKTAQAFASWDVNPAGILYLSLKQPNHPENQWGLLLWLIGELAKRAEHLTAASTMHAVRFVIGQHLAWMKKDETKNRLMQVIGSPTEAEEAVRKQEEIAAELAAEAEKLQSLPLLFQQEANRILDNANLIPAPTRDLAHQYLQSEKPGFKVGLLFSARRTKEEISRRRAEFQQALQENVRIHAEKHLADLWRKYAQELQMDPAPGLARLADVADAVTPDWVRGQIHSGAVFTNEYTMNYASAASGEIKQMFRKLLPGLKEELEEAVRREAANRSRIREEQLGPLAAVAAAYREWRELEREEERYRERFSAFLADGEAPAAPELPDLAAYEFCPEDAPAALEAASAKTAAALEAAIAQTDAAAETVLSPGAPPLLAKTAEPSGSAARLFRPEDSRRKLAETAELIEAACREIADLPAMRSAVRSLREKAERLRSNLFTVVLFGAFSAGKSSFANALLGERLLPVSPNPTTAAISKILPPNGQCAHGTVRIYMKPEETIAAEIQQAAEYLGLSFSDVDSSLAQIRAIRPEQVSEKGKPHLAFLQAVAEGWHDAKPALGQALNADLAAFRDYAAVESKSCFVREIELYYSCPFTDLGMVLVDTPGADSINARHTGVAFNYIKESDAVLFVTYYNHAFSHADREFLQQLGRVKDSFSLDKMFFVVNAADLANDREELRLVVDYVAERLTEFGIRQPRIYPLSSLQALDGKTNRIEDKIAASGIRAFEADFFRFLMEELTEIVIRSAKQEIRRAAAMLEEWIREAEEAEDVKQGKREELLRQHARIEELLSGRTFTEDKGKLLEEIRELMYYVRQRILYRFGELYNSAFHPSVFHQIGNEKRALAAAWNELKQSIRFVCSQELLATTLRIENVLNRLAESALKEMNGEIRRLLPSWEGAPYSACAFATPDVDEQFPAIDVQVSWLAQRFKNGKYFFEEEGKKKLKEELEQPCSAAVTAYVDSHAGRFMAHYEQCLDQRMEELLRMLRRHVQEYVEGRLEALKPGGAGGDFLRRKKALENTL